MIQRDNLVSCPDENLWNRTTTHQEMVYLNGPLELKRVLKKFIRVSPVLNLHIGGKIIGTTGEHPFYVLEKGWLPAGALRIGDLLQMPDGNWLAVEGVADSGRVETVYNLEMEGYHTYFVGEVGWGWSVWAHNATDSYVAALAARGVPANSRLMQHAQHMNLLRSELQMMRTQLASLANRQSAQARALRDTINAFRDAIRQHIPILRDLIKDYNLTRRFPNWKAPIAPRVGEIIGTRA